MGPKIQRRVRSPTSLDFARRLAGRDPSDFYNMERRLTDGHAGYTSVFERFGKTDGGFPASTTNHDVSRQEVESRALEAFAFLEVGGASPTVVGDAGISRVRYVLPSTFVEVELDWRERAAFVLVGGLIDGHVPDGYYVNSAGEKVRWHLAVVLERMGDASTAALLRRATKNSGQTATLDQVVIAAEAPQAHLRDLPDEIQALQHP